MSASLKVSVIIVSYNAKDMLKNCLASVIRHTDGIEYEIIVFDNGSADGSQEMVKSDFPGVILIGNGKNIGFGAANNRARSVARGKYVFFLNSDTVLLNNAVQIFYDFWESCPDKECIGALGCNLLDLEGNITASHGKFFYFKGDLKMYVIEFIHLVFISLNFKYTFRKTAYQRRIGEVDIIVGAALFMKNNDDAAFDERFFLYHEEADMQLRLAEKGKRRLLIDGPEIVHLGGMSDKTKKGKYGHYCSESRMHDYLSRLKYHRKNKKNPVSIFFLKIIVFMLMAFPPLLPETKKHIMELIKI